MSGKKCIVTGGAGFIGSHLVDRLIHEQHAVVVLDNFSTGRQRNLVHHKNSKRLSIIRADIARVPLVKYFRGADFVFHLAGLADIVPSIVNPTEYYRSNVTGTLHIAEAARIAGVQKLVYAASSSCYGIPEVFPTPETAKIMPEYPYALTKYLGEQILLHWAKVYKLPVISLRLFNVYGPRSRTSGTYGAVIGIFLAQKLKNRPFTVVGDGTQERDFVFVTDVADAFVKASHSKISCEVLNVGSGNPQSVNKLVSLIKGEKAHIPRRPGEPQCTWADISKITKMLSWQPKVSFEKGMGIVLKNIDYWKEAPLWTPKKIEEATKDWFRYLSG